MERNKKKGLSMVNIEYEEIKAYRSRITGDIYESIEELKKAEYIFVSNELDKYTIIEEDKIFIDVEEVINLNREYGAEFVDKVLNKLLEYL
jgi:hypothetical protein